jgi:hypothetical protein
MEVMNNRDKDKNIQEESKMMPQPKEEAETLKNLPDTTPPKVPQLSFTLQQAL